MALPIDIGLLLDHNAAVPTVTRWLHREWMHHYGYTPTLARAEVGRRLRRDQLPMSWVALAGRSVVGTVSISADVKQNSAAPSWCLSGLYVSPRWRRRQVATLLCAQATTMASRLQLPALTLYTLDQAAFFRKRGWQDLGTVQLLLSAEPTQVTWMKLMLAQQQV